LGKKSRSGIRIRIKIPDHNYESLEKKLSKKMGYLNSLVRIRIPNLFYPGSGMEKFVSGIRDKHPGSRSNTAILILEFSFDTGSGHSSE
jgi:hypothetical protein